ncbi:PAB-dependent poly(A)-specific ribonuclease subunit 3, partial [Spiromyces aspiralis]
VYDYHPLSISLQDKLFGQVPGRGTTVLDDQELWQVVVQIVIALRKIHSAGLAHRYLHAQSVVFTAKDRVRLDGCAIAHIDDLGMFNIQQLQKQDLISLGRLILTIKGNMLNINAGGHDVPLEAVVHGDVRDLSVWGAALIGAASSTVNIDQVARAMSSQIIDLSEGLENNYDGLCTELSKELENGRFARLLCKLNFITERPECERDTKWSETGDRYLIKLFRDYVFHQVNERGAPVLDAAHVITNLNKLDAGSLERVMLTSRDEHSCLIVTYRDIKRCVENAYTELVTAANTPYGAKHAGHGN